MGSKDRYAIQLKCPTCGRQGTADLVENDYSYTPPETSVERVSDGFHVTKEGGTLNKTEIVCSKCGLRAND